MDPTALTDITHVLWIGVGCLALCVGALVYLAVRR